MKVYILTSKIPGCDVAYEGTFSSLEIASKMIKKRLPTRPSEIHFRTTQVQIDDDFTPDLPE
jgi:hypothetical protein